MKIGPFVLKFYVLEEQNKKARTVTRRKKGRVNLIFDVQNINFPCLECNVKTMQSKFKSKLPSFLKC